MSKINIRLKEHLYRFEDKRQVKIVLILKGYRKANREKPEKTSAEAIKQPITEETKLAEILNGWHSTGKILLLFVTFVLECP